MLEVLHWKRQLLLCEIFLSAWIVFFLSLILPYDDVRVCDTAALETHIQEHQREYVLHPHDDHAQGKHRQRTTSVWLSPS